MKKYLLITLGLLIITPTVLSVLLYFFLPLDAIKDYAATKLSEQLKREVKIKKASFNIFSGIKLVGVAISNGRGFAKDPMVSADSFELKYAFLPLFQGKIIIPEITLVKPKILIEKDARGFYNFSDMLEPQTKKKRKENSKENPKKPGPSIGLLINSIKIRDGKITYHDYFTGKSELKNLDVKISNIILASLSPIGIDIKARAYYLGKDIPIRLSGKVVFDLGFDSGNIKDLILSIAGETISASADLKNLKKAPRINLSISSQKLAADPFFAIFATGGTSSKKEKTPHGALTKSLQSSFSNIPLDISIASNFDLKNVTVKTLKIDSLKFNFTVSNRKASFDIKEFLAYKGNLYAKEFLFDLPALSYSLGKLELHGFSAAPFLNDMIDSFLPNLIDMKNNVEGALDISIALKGKGVEMPEAFENVNASGVILLSKGRIRRLKSLASIGEQYNINLLKHDMAVGGLRINASIANKVLNVGNLALQDTDLQAYFSGGLDFNNMLYKQGNRLTLKFSPAATQSLPQEFSVFKDEKGFVAAEFELQGSLFKPFPSPILTKPLEAAIGKLKVKIEAKKIEFETQAQQQLKTIEAEAKKKFEEEAKKKVREILKF